MSPREEYAHRLADRQARLDALARQERWIGNGRVVVFLLGVLLAYLAFGAHLLSGWWLLVPAGVFTVLLFRHDVVTRALIRLGRSVAFYERGLARLEDRWIGTGQPGQRFLDESHPYAADLDLFGPGSLFELLCNARTRTGEDTLASWLKAPAAPDEVRARQKAVEELRGRLDLREDLALLGASVPHGVDFEGLVAWGRQPPILVSRPLRVLVTLLGLAALVCVYGWLGEEARLTPPLAWAGIDAWWGASPLIAVLFLQTVLLAFIGRTVHAVVGAIEKRGHDLALLSGVLSRLEQETFSSPRLHELRAALEATGDVPSQRIAQLTNLIDLLNSRRNQLFMPIVYLVMWTTQMAYALENWRRRSGPAIGDWLHIVGQFEALCSLAAYSYENPADPFPEILDSGHCLEGEELGHPLIPASRCVRNDIALGGRLRVLVISGSNMSGKSTFLRTVGVNAVLALAGAPVRARRLKLAPVMVGATLRIQDSLQAGRSRFYAELLRVRQVVDLSRGRLPLLFLLDEIFHGTNSHDRRQGAQAVVKGLVKAGAMGLVTTHDLSLTHIAEELGEQAANVHFADHFENGQMVFDYKMRPGVVRNSNAIALMRAVGLEV